MLFYYADALMKIWGPFRLFKSYLVLISLGTAAAGLLTWYVLPRAESLLPRDRGRAEAVQGAKSKGKPTGAGVVMTLVLLPVLALVLPATPEVWGATACLALAMLTGFGDDAAAVPWGPWRKGLLDLVVASLTACAMSGFMPAVIWLPLVKNEYVLSFAAYLLVAVPVLWFSINATNCTDGVDGLAGSLTLLALFYLGVLLYGVVGHRVVASYLLVPHNRDGARWAVLVFAGTGALAGYLWHNAEPSRVLMGDAGSRMLGLLTGVAVLAAGNPFLILVVAPVILVNGGGGLVKLGLLRLLGRLGFDVRRPALRGDSDARPHILIRALHSIRFPLHDHCRRNLKWSNAQVLMRFVLIQAFLTPLLLVLLLKVR